MRAGSPSLLRQINDRAAVEALLRNGPLTRAELEAITGLSKPATAHLLTRLEEDDVVRRAGLRESGGRGPRAQQWMVNNSLAHVAAIDLTPDAVDVAIVDIAGTLVAEHQAPVPRADSAAALAAFAAAMREATAKAGLRPADLEHVVVGSPGSVNPATGRLGFAPHMPWEGMDMPGRLGGLLDAPVTVENDVNLVALAEMINGRAVDVRDFVLIWPAGLVGGAVVVNRVLLRGATGGAGEIDSVLIPDVSEKDTGVGRAGARYGELLGRPAVLALAQAHGLHAETGLDAVCEAVSSGAGAGFLADLARRISAGLVGVVSLLDPELVLLAGDVAQAGGDVLRELIATELHARVAPRTPVELASVTGNPVRAGATHAALAVAREEVFGLPADDMFGSST